MTDLPARLNVHLDRALSIPKADVASGRKTNTIITTLHSLIASL